MPATLKYLFIGDSVTDCARSESTDDLGDGYVKNLARPLAARNGVVINRGISGNRVIDLLNRWDTDCLHLQPDTLTVLIGVNDTWRRYSQQDATSTESYRTGYHTLLTQARATNPRLQLVLVEPFILPIRPDQVSWIHDDLTAKIAAVHQLAETFSARLIPAHRHLTQQATEVGASRIAADGIHPTPLGHKMLADLWLSTTGNATADPTRL